ncbi:glycoside hydrolase [Massarina eburnea CBS 473.64]|uniref:glucan 1,3-beta-glucosidase n=1 Tax=Massarina eburnea CBS 473.64 TaxID=1395130 RepID=A0A6A6RN80_9PLEO|nr:glycoside hydrolase [Massarina eburnea CBS 473.64]
MDAEYRERRRREQRDSQARDLDRDSSAHNTERRQRRGHRATDSQGELLNSTPRHSRHQSDSEKPSPSPRKHRSNQSQPRSRAAGESRSRNRASVPAPAPAPLSLDALASLDKANQKKAGWRGYDYDEEYLKEVRRKEKKLEKERTKEETAEKRKERERIRLLEADAAVERETRKRREREDSQRRPGSQDSRRRDTEDNVRREREESRKRGRAESRRREKRQSAAAAALAVAAVATDDEGTRSAFSERNVDKGRNHADPEMEERRQRYQEELTASEIAEKMERRKRERQERLEAKKRRVVSGPLAEEGGVDDEDEYQYMMEKRGGAGAPSQYSEDDLARRKKKKKWIIIAVVSVVALLAVIIPVALSASKKKTDPGSSTTGSTAPLNSNLDGKDRNSVPEKDRGGILDPWAWYDTIDFNVTYTPELVGGLPVIGLNSTWDDNVQANSDVPNLQEAFEYGKMPVRGINAGGWLNIEPFITPSLFEKYSTRENIVDEWTLCTKLGAATCKDTLEKHYSSFMTKSSFAAMRDAGFDHVRIPFGYWMVQTYDGDAYVPQVSWRYLLRGIEYARQNGLRVNLDFHGAPGSQNGWNHSGRQGVIGWLNGTDGDTNAQRWLDIHHQISVFFAQPRYKNVVTMYGLVNEPRMVELNTDIVVKWTQKAIDQIRTDNISAVIVFGDGFMGLDNWQGRLQGNKNLLLDVHQYVIFNIDQLSLTHTDKLNFACNAWTQQSLRSMNTSTGFGPTMCGEWSQADTDCTQYINDVNTGTRWEGTYDTGNSSTSILAPQCPAKDASCSCTKANEDPDSYSDAYKRFLMRFAIAQIEAFEKGWGWFYWTWETERATQWSWRRGVVAGILPTKVGSNGWTCPESISGFEDFGGEGLSELY